MEFRAVSQRPDGLWDEGVYLTTSDKDLSELTQWPINSDFADPWTGTVVVLHGGQEDIGDASLGYGEYVFFGDRELLAKIRQSLED